MMLNVAFVPRVAVASSGVLYVMEPAVLDIEADVYAAYSAGLEFVMHFILLAADHSHILLSF